MTNYIKVFKVISLLLVSYLFFCLLIFNYKPVTIDSLFNKSNYINFVFLVSIASTFVILNSFIYLTEKSKVYAWFTLVLFLICLLTGTYFLYPEFNKSLITSFILSLALVPSTIVTLSIKKRYVNIEKFEIFRFVQKYTAFFIALSFALSFYYFEKLDPNDINIKPFINTIVNTSIMQIPNNQTQNVGSGLTIKEMEKKLNEQIASLTGENLDYYNNNKQLIDGIFNAYIKGDIPSITVQPINQVNSKISNEISTTLQELIIKYKTYILIFGSAMVYFFISGVFFISNFFLIPMFVLIFNILVRVGIFEKTKITIEAQRLEL